MPFYSVVKFSTCLLLVQEKAERERVRVTETVKNNRRIMVAVKQ